MRATTCLAAACAAVILRATAEMPPPAVDVSMGGGTAKGMGAEITLENEAFRLVLADSGEAKSLVVKETNVECLMPGVRVPFVTIVQSRPYDNEYKLILPAKPWRIPSTGIVQRGDSLEVRFKDEFFVLKLRVKKAADYMLFTPEGVGYEIEAFGDKRPTEIDALEFLRLPVRERAHFGKCANVAWDEPAAVAVMAEEPSVEVDARRSEGTEGWRVFQAGTITQLGLWGKGAALMATPAKGFLTAVDAFERDCALPRGVAMRRDPLAAASYWMMGAVNPANVDEHIRLMKKGGFRIGMVSYSAFASTCGHFAWRKTYPNGLADLRAVADKMRAAGIVPGLHFHYNKVSTDDAYVSGGVPDPRLATVQHVVLARDASPTDTTLCVEGNLAALRRERGRRLVLFGQELVSFEDVSSNRLVGVQRGVYGSRPAAHLRHAYGRHLDVDDWPRFIRIDQDTDLQDEIAGCLAELINGAGFRLFYFDGAEDTPQPFWHYVPFAQRRVWEKVKTPVIAAETAQKSHWGWHMFARGNAFDVFTPEYTRAAMEKYVLRCARDAADDFSTVNFGWIGVRAPGDRIRVADFLARSGKMQTTAGTQVDQIEYVACKALAWNAPLSVMGNLDVFRRHPRADELLAALKRWEDAKLSGAIPPDVREEMKDPKREWSLRPTKDGGAELVEITGR